MYSQKRCKFLLDGTTWMSGAHERVICENEKRLCQPSTALRRQTRLLQADAILKISAPGRERDSRFWDTRGGEMPVVHPGRHAHMTPAAASRLLIVGGSPLAPLADHCPDAGTARRYPLDVEMFAG